MNFLGNSLTDLITEEIRVVEMALLKLKHNKKKYNAD